MPALLITQLMSAEVYARFVSMAEGYEKDLWKKMLEGEISHVNYLRNVFDISLPDELTLPSVNIYRMEEVCDRVTLHGMDSFILRLEGALRLESAELDYGLESLSAKRFAEHDLIVHYPGDIAEHLDDLIRQARHYRASPNIAVQIARLEELYDTTLGDDEPDQEYFD